MTDPREDELPKLPLLSAPRTPFNASIGPHRRFAYTTVSLEDARQIRRAFGVTFNDVVMALCAATLRKYLQLHDVLPTEPLVAMVPISVRRADEEDLFRNRVSALTCELATDEADPVKRPMRISRRMSEAEGPLRSRQRRRTAGFHPVRSAGCCRTGDAPAQPAAHRRPLQLPR